MPTLLDRVSRFIDDVLLLPDDLRAQLEDAEDALEAQEYETAAELFALVLVDRPTLARAAVGLAQAREGLGEMAEARAALETARTVAPDDPDVAMFQARLALQADDFDTAADAARDAASRWASDGGPKLAEACALRARAERGRGRPDRAVRELKKALSVTPDDVELRVQLLEAHVAARQVGAARSTAATLEPQDVDDRTAVRVGLALHQVGAGDVAMPWLERGAEVGDEAALRTVAQHALEAGELDAAERAARQAVQQGGRGPAIALVAAVEVARRRYRDAVEAFLAAASMATDGAGRTDALRSAARVAPLDDSFALRRVADALEAVAPSDPAALAARAWAGLAEGIPDGAHALSRELGEPRVQLARARVSLDDGTAATAIEALDAWDELMTSVQYAGVDREHAIRLRREALRALWQGPGREVDLAAAIDAVVRFAEDHELPETARRGERLRDELDRPLLVAVMGEFNAGKSTFINAFVGADVAPTGIVPTTATLNVLRGGAERRVRVVRTDGTTREGSYEDLRRFLDEIEAADDDTAVDQVEIVLPSENLERVWILDTPGTNALDSQHEKLAREAARRADAVLWVFDAGQAGKDSEAKTIRGLTQSRRLVVPVLNKADRLRPEQIDQVRAVLAAELPEVGVVPAISGREALRARLAGDEARYEASGFPALLARLEEQVFSRSRSLKRAAIASRLLDALDEGLVVVRRTLDEADVRIAELVEAGEALAGLSRTLVDAVDGEIRALDRDVERAYAAAAHEVLAFVRPRRHRFQRHGSDLEDRAFLAEVLERQLGGAADAFESRLLARGRAAVATSTAEWVGDASTTDARLRAAVRTPTALYVGLQRGVLRGGGLRRFFEEALPDVELEPDAVARALARSRIDPRVELRRDLVEAVEELAQSFDADRRAAIAREQAHRDRWSARVLGPLEGLRAVLAELGA